MPESTQGEVVAVVPVEVVTPVAPAEPVESPPPSAMPARDESADARTRLHQLAHELIKTHNRRLLVEYLQLRRTLR
jgi:hypothetical protein